MSQSFIRLAISFLEIFLMPAKNRRIFASALYLISGFELNLSKSSTSQPALAKETAMPVPIVPAPITALLFCLSVILELLAIFSCLGSSFGIALRHYLRQYYNYPN